ncbi:MAG: hypothetical protein LBN07_00585 [Christensenellaceae bacterium]|jgi:hypothetical protein|nr:hypothetical protein [Christensenellaceae bacterium]
MEVQWIILIVFGALVLLGLIFTLIIKARQNHQNEQHKNAKRVPDGDDNIWSRSDKDAIEKKKQEEFEKELKKLKDKEKNNGYDFYEEMKKNTPNPLKDLTKGAENFSLAKSGGRLAGGAAISVLGALKRKSTRTRMTSPVSGHSISSPSMGAGVGGSSVSPTRTPTAPSPAHIVGTSSPNGVSSGGRISDGVDMKYEAYKSLRDHSLSLHAFVRGKGAWWDAFEDIKILAATREILQKFDAARETFRSDEPPAWKEAREKAERDMWAKEKLKEKYGIDFEK